MLPRRETDQKTANARSTLNAFVRNDGFVFSFEYRLSIDFLFVEVAFHLNAINYCGPK